MQAPATTMFLGLLAAACGLAGSQAVRPAGSTKLDGGAPSVTTQLEGESSELGEVVSRPPLDLEAFRPLLARSELSEVRYLVDDGEPSKAADKLEAHVGGSKHEPLEELRAHYLLGALRARAGQADEARAAFEHAAHGDWTLQQDALLHVAALAQDAGDGDVALGAISRLRDLRDTAPAHAIFAAASFDQKRFDQAADAWRKALEKDDTAEARFQLARSLLAFAEEQKPGDARKNLATEAAHQAKRSTIGLSSDDEISRKAEALLMRAVASGAPQHIERTTDQKLEHLRGLVQSRDFDDAWEAASHIAVPSAPSFVEERCEYDYLVGKVLAGQRKWGEAADRIASSAGGCSEFPEMHAWLLFNAGKYSAADGRHTKAVAYYAKLERLFPENSLADDARLRAAKSYERQGIAARFIELLSKMPDDYPQGDMTMEGVLTLALHRIERKDWAGAAQVLQNGARVVRDHDSARGHEYSGTERYFLARAQQQLGQEEEALTEYESIVREVPLSYYMLHAYSRLLEADPERAQRALSEGLAQAKKFPFEFPHRPEYDSLQFSRAMELFRVGDSERGRVVLEQMGLQEGADDSLLWGLALLYDRAGEAHTSHSIARGQLTDWLAHYPEGSWQKPWQIGFPRPYHSIVTRESQATGVPEWFIYGVMREESTFRPRVVSHASAYGLMQIIEPTARGIAKESGHPATPDALKRPAVNIAIGSRVLEQLDRYFRENPWLAIPGYNAGPGRPKRWLRERPDMDFDVWVEMIPYRETRRYTKRVLASRAAYAFLYYREDSQTALVLPKRLTPP